MAAKRFRHYPSALLGAAATATALLTAACSGTATVATNGSTATVQWKAVQETPASGNPGGGGQQQQTGSGDPSATNQKLMFPNTSFTASIVSYDTGAHMVVFQVMDYTPGGPDDGSYTPDPNKPGDYRLPLAADVQVKGELYLCPGITQPELTGVSCTKDQFIQALENSEGDYADVNVDATDHITAISERYHP